MTALVLIALLNGCLIAASRSINGRLGMSIGALRSSFWNHLGGLILLTALLAGAGLPDLGRAFDAPPLVYCGGILGALFVAMNSRVLPRLGAVMTVALVIAGQMATGLAIEYPIWGISPRPLQIVAVALIVLGAVLARRASHDVTRCNNGLIRAGERRIEPLEHSPQADRAHNTSPDGERNL